VEIINWVEREAQKLCGRSPYYIVQWIKADRGVQSNSSIPSGPSRDPLVTPSSDQPMTLRHACVLRPLQVTCDRNIDEATTNEVKY